mgnify:CR=1 FL=1
MREQPRIIISRFVPKRFCVNLFGTIWTRDASWIDRYVVNHERIHTAQQRELLWIPFYIIYFFEWLFRLVQKRRWYAAYQAISFEREAYSHDHDLTYLSHRRHFAQWRRCADSV